MSMNLKLLAVAVFVAGPAGAALPGLGTIAPAVLAQASDARVTIPIEGMTCASCTVAVKVALRKVPGVKEVEATFEPSRAVVTYDAAKASPDQFVAAINDLGYSAGKPASAP